MQPRTARPIGKSSGGKSKGAAAARMGGTAQASRCVGVWGAGGQDKLISVSSVVQKLIILGNSVEAHQLERRNVEG